MKEKVQEIRNLLEGISCLCAEGVEFMSKLQLSEKIQELTLKAIKECDSVLNPSKRREDGRKRK